MEDNLRCKRVPNLETHLIVLGAPIAAYLMRSCYVRTPKSKLLIDYKIHIVRKEGQEPEA